MSLPLQHARGVVQGMRAVAIRNLIAQAKAKQVLREVHELPVNFPQFTADKSDFTHDDIRCSHRKWGRKIEERTNRTKIDRAVEE